MPYVKRRMKYRGANIGKIVADLVATLADDEKIEILREPNINDNARHGANRDLVA